MSPTLMVHCDLSRHVVLDSHHNETLMVAFVWCEDAIAGVETPVRDSLGLSRCRGVLVYREFDLTDTACHKVTSCWYTCK